MEVTKNVIIYLNLFCLLPCLILLVAACRTSSRRSLLFAWLVGLNMIGLASEAAIWVFEYNTSTLSYYVVRISTGLNFVAGCGKVVVFGEYLYACLAPRIAVSRKPFQIIWLASILACVLAQVLQYWGAFAYFDEENVFHAQSGYIWSQILPHICLAFLFVLTCRYGKYLPKRQLSALRWYFLLFFACSATLFVISTDLVLHFIIGVLSQMILYINIQNDEAQELELELAESRTATMLSQIGPHFILNALTDIRQLCRMEPQRAEQALLHFSRYLRGNIDSLASRSPIYFTKELEHLGHYLWLETMRFGDKLRVVINDGGHEFLIPAFILQPLVENAVRHGITKKEGGGTVTVTVTEEAAAWRIIVSDDGRGFDPEAVPGDERIHTGIENVRGRLAVLCGGTLTLTSAPGEGTQVVVEIPKDGRS